MNELLKLLKEKYGPDYSDLSKKQIAAYEFVGFNLAKDIIGGDTPDLDKKIANTVRGLFDLPEKQ